MIKGKPPIPFQTIALAFGFSSRLEALIAETRRLSQVYQARTIFVHVGKKTSEKQRQLGNFLVNYGFNDSNSKIIWENGETVDVILKICKQEVVDLLVIGALEKENILKYYMGSVSREISRKAKCSVLMLTKPSIQPSAFQKIVVNGHDHPKTIYSIETAFYIAQREDSDEVYVVDEVDIPALSMSMADDSTEPQAEGIRSAFIVEEQDKLNTILKTFPEHDGRVKVRTIQGRSGHTISLFAKERSADLLVVNSPDHLLSIFDRIFTHDIEYLLNEMPCNLLVVHSRIPPAA